MNKYLLLAALVSVAGAAYAQDSYDAQTFANSDLNGTARFVAMGGALGALGGDVSVMSTNPAGTGMYRSSDAAISISGLFTGDGAMGHDGSRMSLDQGGVLIAFDMDTPTNKGLQFVNFGVNYQKKRNFLFNQLTNVQHLEDTYSQTFQIADLCAYSLTNDYWGTMADMSAGIYSGNRRRGLLYESYFDKDENKVLTPLHKATKRGSSSADWNKAYQAIKHNRGRELSKGNIKHFLHGLAALYVLNLYYRDERIINLPEKEKPNVNPSFGSSLFAVKIHKVGGFNVDNSYIKNADYDECVYIEDHESTSKQKAMEAMAMMTDYINNASHIEYEKLIRENFNKGETPTKEWIEQHQIDVIKKVLPVKDINLGKLFNNAMTGIRYEILLNKHQY